MSFVCFSSNFQVILFLQKFLTSLFEFLFISHSLLYLNFFLLHILWLFLYITTSYMFLFYRSSLCFVRSFRVVFSGCILHCAFLVLSLFFINLLNHVFHFTILLHFFVFISFRSSNLQASYPLTVLVHSLKFILF